MAENFISYLKWINDYAVLNLIYSTAKLLLFLAFAKPTNSCHNRISPVIWLLYQLVSLLIIEMCIIISMCSIHALIAPYINYECTVKLQKHYFGIQHIYVRRLQISIKCIPTLINGSETKSITCFQI